MCKGMECLVNTSSNTMLSHGTKIIGRWNGRVYKVERFLGKGTNGQVYLVVRNKRRFALKLGNDPVDLQSEVNVLQKIDRNIRPGSPFLIDVDDFYQEGRSKPFYVMRYVQGKSADVFLRKHGMEWLHLIGKNLLMRLHELHQQGWIFGDLKLGNMLVGEYGQVELIDYGGVTKAGQAVKQFTEQYDRGYWNRGSRIADERYDLFSFAIFMIKLIAPDATNESPYDLPQNRSVDMLIKHVEQTPFLPYVPVLKKLLYGNIPTTKEALAYWKKIDWVGEQPHSVRNLHYPKSAFVHSLFAIALCFFMIVVYLFLL